MQPSMDCNIQSTESEFDEPMCSFIENNPRWKKQNNWSNLDKEHNIDVNINMN